MTSSAQIADRLREIEKEQDVQILYACESGSRAWGFASSDSDFDIRFIYRRSLNDYLALKEVKDTIEYPIQDNLDFNGWDLKKFLLHFGKSNGVMFEWLQSPIVYSDVNHFRKSLHAVMPTYFCPRSTLNHYLGLAKRTLLEFGEEPSVKLKKYFYILRPFLAARWVCRNRSIPPMVFNDLLASAGLDETIHQCITELRAQKEASDESTKIPRLQDLESFVLKEMNSYEEVGSEFSKPKYDLAELNTIFRQHVLPG